MLVALGCAALALGWLVYLTDREASHALLVPTVAALAGGHWFGALGGSLPSFAHALAFSLLTAAALPPRSAWRYGACAAWFAVNVAFEVGQHAHVSARLADVLPASFVTNYFVGGTFDGGDIVAALLGALAAAIVLRSMPAISENQHAS